MMSNQTRKELNLFFHQFNFNAKIVLIDDTFNLWKYFTYNDKQATLRHSNVVYTNWL